MPTPRFDGDVRGLDEWMNDPSHKTSSYLHLHIIHNNTGRSLTLVARLLLGSLIINH